MERYKFGIKNKNQRLNIEYIKYKTAKLAKGYECLSEEYINARTKLKFRCDKGHIFYMAWYNFKIGRRCIKCHLKNREVWNKLDIKKIKELTKKFEPNHECISNYYINNTKKLIFRCGKRHIYKVSWMAFIQGVRCRKCSREYMSKIMLGEGNPA